MKYLSRSRGTVVNLYDLTTRPSWVQAPNAAIRRIGYSAIGVIQKVTESQARKWYRQALTDNGCWAKKKKKKP